MIAKKVDLIVPVYNKSAYLICLLDSFKQLPVEYFNVIIIDDGSTDDSVNFIEFFIQENNTSNIYLYKKDNGGVSSARNVGLQKAVSEYVWFVDPDDQINLDFLSRFNELKNLNDDILIFEYTLNFNKNKKKLKKFYEYGIVDKRKYLLENDALLTKSIDINILWNKWYRKKNIESIFFDEEIIIGEDRCFNIDVFYKNGRARVLNINIYNYYFYGTGTLSSDIDIRKIKDIYTVNVKNMSIYDYRRDTVKRHIMNQIYLRLSIYEKDLFLFYVKEHEKFGIKIFPLYNYREFILLIIIFSNFYRFFYFFRKYFFK